MSSDDVREIIRKFYICLRNNVNPQEITPIIDDLTNFDRQQILATAKHEGDMVGNDKLLDAIKRRSTRCFASFVTHLRNSNSDLADDIIIYTRKHFPHIHTSIQHYQEQQTRPFATVRPSPSTSTSLTSHTCSSTVRPSTRTDAGTQEIFTRVEQSRELYSTNNLSVQSSHRTTEVQTKTFTKETVIEHVPNIVFKKWAAELNNDKQWNKLGDVMELSRKQIKELRVNSNPGEEILDILCEKPDVTVHRLMHLLECAELTSVLDIIRQTLEPTTVLYERTDQTITQTQTANDDYAPQIPNNARHTVAEPTNTATNPTTERSEPPVAQMQHMNISDESIKSTSDNEEVQQTEPDEREAEGGTKNIIRNLNTTTIKIDAVKEVHIHINSDTDKTPVVKDTNVEAEVEDDSFNQEVSSEENTTTKQNDPIFTRSMEDNEISSDTHTKSLQDNSAERGSPVASSSHSIIDDGQGQTSLDESLVTRQHTLNNPIQSSVMDNNLEQEHAAFNRDLQNQPNPESNTDIPGTGSSSDSREPVTGQLMFVQPEECLNFEKNVDQEYNALQRDSENQPRLESFRNIQNSLPDENQPRLDSFRNIQNSIPDENQPRLESFRNIQNSIPDVQS